MPIIDPAIIASCRAKIDAEFGPIPPGLKPSQVTAINNRRDRLAEVVANSGQYVRDNAQVNVGQSVNVPALGLIDSQSLPVTGAAVGTVVTTGTIS